MLPTAAAHIDWSTATAPQPAWTATAPQPAWKPSMDVPARDGGEARRPTFARRRPSGPADVSKPSSLMHVLGRASSDQWKTFASSPLMAAALLIDGETYDD
jgi:hypothetical protein